MKILKIDDKWSVQYDPDNNDRPVCWLRYGQQTDHYGWDESNAVLAMFYKLLAESH